MYVFSAILVPPESSSSSSSFSSSTSVDTGIAPIANDVERSRTRTNDDEDDWRYTALNRYPALHS